MLPSVTELAQSIPWLDILKAALLVFAAICIIGGVLRLIFGKGSSLVRSVSACVSIAMVYLTTILIYVFVPSLRGGLTSLPFISVTSDAFYLWDIANLSNGSLYPALLQLFILAFLVNLLETLLPQGKKLVSWYLWRMLTVVAALGLYGGVSTLIHNFAPEVYGSWAGPVLLGLWFVIALSGIAKLILTVALAAVNPVVAAVYAFFFSNLFGKQFTKSILTTLLLVLVFVGLYRFGFLGFVFTGFSLAAYAPTCLIALVALYLFGKLL